MIVRKRNLTLSFAPEIIEAICAYGEAAGLESMQDAVRQLVAMALSATPQEALLLAAQQRAYLELKKYGLTTMSFAVAQMLADMRNAIQDPEMLSRMLGNLAPMPHGETQG